MTSRRRRDIERRLDDLEGDDGAARQADADDSYNDYEGCPTTS